jgi:DNA-binding transcriptional MerR regulator
MTTHPSIEETLRERRSRLAREIAELQRDELQEENDRLRKELDRKDPQNSKRAF